MSMWQVFDKLLQDIEVHAGQAVTRVEEWVSAGDGRRTWEVRTADGARRTGFHRVVFASNARHVAEVLYPLGFAAKALLLGVDYTQEKDPSFTKGIIHSDQEVLPADCREELLANYANYIGAEIRGGSAEGGAVRTEHVNTFILSSWYPAAQSAGDGRPRLVTYNCAEMPRGVVGEVENQWNHPHLCLGNLISSSMLQLLQGHHGVYFCGSFATPGNGHDLSLCSGMAVAVAMGAEYPFMRDPDCARDFKKLQALMGVRDGP
ncbi:hypothetical protein CYMTET_18186 [Cymbomonas tetramitiformis]|uniref:Uncharacterized protein n=1 Tax=Cymbomonas tetramitiformis TaxID=36881 RepID=A0AAE0G8S0_9CHLO|nr:hypothetical protein CYMTET_18186 [Cymbomonas tetramitiformis]